MSDWLSLTQATDLVKREAENLATQLGHRMTAWLPIPAAPLGCPPPPTTRHWMARCHKCMEAAHVAPRMFSQAPMSGAALSLRCR